MRHLTDDQLLDAAEGTLQGTAAAHLALCGSCEREVASLRATLSAAVDVGVPEPSPLFWDQLSRRVREAVADEDVPRRGLRWPLPWRIAIPVVVAAMALMTVLPTWWFASREQVLVDEMIQPPDVDVMADVVPASNGSLDVLGELASDLDWETAAEVGLPTHAGTINRLVVELTEDEREELARLLREELGQSGV